MLGVVELEVVCEVFEIGGLEVVLLWVCLGLECLGSVWLDLVVVGKVDVGFVVDMLFGLDFGDLGVVFVLVFIGFIFFLVLECLNVVFWVVFLGFMGIVIVVVVFYLMYYDVFIFVIFGVFIEKDWV